MNLNSVRVGGLAGLGFASIVMTVNVILATSGQPFAGASPGEVEAYFADSGIGAAVGSMLAPLAWVLLPLFGAGVAAAARRASVAEGDAWPLVGLVGTVMQNAVFTGVVACQVVLAGGGLSTDASWAVWQLHNALFSLNAVSLALIMGALSIAGLRTGLIRRWHATLGFAAAAVMTTVSVATPFTLDGGALGMAGFAGFLGWVVWLATYGVRLLRAVQPTPAVASVAAVPTTI